MRFLYKLTTAILVVAISTGFTGATAAGPNTFLNASSKIATSTTSPCGYYIGDYADGALIPLATLLPKNPLTSKAFERVFDYAAVNNLDNLTIHYSVAFQESYRPVIMAVFKDMVARYQYEKPEYFIYTPRVTIRINTQPKCCSFELNIQWNERDSSVVDGFSLRKEAFCKASEIRSSLYKSGQLSAAMSEKQRARVFLEYVLDNTTYKNDETGLSHTAWAALCAGYGVCDAYSGALQLLLRIDGINSWGRWGTIIEDGSPHHWTVASLDGQLVNIDATWCDSSKNEQRDKYFAVTDQFLSATHKW